MTGSGMTGGCSGGCAPTRAATPGHPRPYKETMLRRVSLTLLLAIQALGGGAIPLAHTRDAVVAPPGFEASHNARCAILHDELRCALCHYASARVVTQQAFTLPTPATTVRVAPVPRVFSVAATIRLTAPARAPPLVLSCRTSIRSACGGAIGFRTHRRGSSTMRRTLCVLMLAVAVFSAPAVSQQPTERQGGSLAAHGPPLPAKVGKLLAVFGPHPRATPAAAS